LHDGDAGVLLGFVMAHELGHVLLGAGHTPDGVMQAAWGEMYALRQRWLSSPTNVRTGSGWRSMHGPRLYGKG
jgi:hypothetical protein